MKEPSLYGAKALSVTCKASGATAVALPTGFRTLVVIPNPSSKVYLRVGNSEVECDSAGFPIPAGAQPMRFAVVGATHIIGYAAEDTTVEVVPGG